MLRLAPVLALLASLSVCCGGSAPSASERAAQSGGPSSRIEQRSLSDRPPLSVIERDGDPEAAIAFASLSSGNADLHSALGELLNERMKRAGFQTQLVVHGLGFELMLLADGHDAARGATQALLKALATPVSPGEVPPTTATATPTPPSAVAACAGELEARGRQSDAGELDRERVAAFARDRSAWAVVGDGAAASAVAQALSAGPDWPELGGVRSSLPERPQTQVLRGERAGLSVALTLADPNRALGAAAQLAEPDSALSVRLAALGAGLRLRRVAATAHPHGACLRIDSDVDASPVPEARRLGFAIQVIEDEANLALGRVKAENRLESSAVSAADPRAAARAAAYRALIEPGSNVPGVRVVALTAPAEAPLSPSIDAAVEQAQAEAPQLEPLVKVESGQPGVWALVATPCATNLERADNAGHAAVLLAAAASGGSTRHVRLEPWLGAEGAGLLGFAERLPGETEADAAARLGDALGRALLAPPTAIDVASARGELIKAAGSEPHPLLDGLLDTLAPGHFGALAPRGSVTSLQTASREAVLTRQRELLRLPHRLAILSPSNAADAGALTRSLSRWLKTPDASRNSPCASEVAAPARGDVALGAGVDTREGSYVAFRVPAKSGPEAAALAEILNLPGGALARALAEPDLVGAARAFSLGTSSARAFVVQVSAFEGRDAEAVSRVQKLFERVASGGALVSADVEQVLGKQRHARRLAALDPRYRLLQLLEAAPAPAVDAAALRRLAASLRPETAILARPAPPATPARR
ncbi:MAG TPA: hypothetical protein VHB79_12025 [Polyangiaceae bacterium]|nr:hypothetical protein [Polyangiaceae bacterium]